MTAEVLRNTFIVVAVLMQIGALGLGAWATLINHKISAKGDSRAESRHEETISRIDELRCDVQKLGVSAVVSGEPEEFGVEQQLKQLSFPEVKKLLGDLRVQRKLLQNAFERTTEDGDYVHDLSTRLNCLIGTDDGLLYLVMQKLEIGISCYDKFDPEKKRYDLNAFFQRKDYKATVDGVESAYSVQNIIHLMATKEGGAQIDLTVDAALRRLTKGIKFGSHDAGAYILLRTAKQLLGDVDLVLDTAEKYYVTPMELICRGDSLKQQGDYDGSIAAFNEAKKILSEYRVPHSHYLIQVEGHLSCVYYINGEYSLALQHAETANSLLGDKEWTGNLAPLCKEGVAFALLKLNLPSSTDDARAAYLCSIELLNETVRLKKINTSDEHTPFHLNHGALALAFLFTEDFVSAASAAKDANVAHPCQAYVALEGIALLGLERYAKANELFRAITSSTGLSRGLINYSNELASKKKNFSLQDAWFFYSSSRLENQNEKDPLKMRLDGF